jgi:hypothetical protein
MQAIIHAADIQDRDGGLLLMGSLFGLFPFLLKLYADGGYQGAKFQEGLHKVWAANRARDREAMRYRQVHGLAQTLDCRAYDRLAQPLPPAGKRLECLNRNALGFLHPSA